MKKIMIIIGMLFFTLTLSAQSSEMLGTYTLDLTNASGKNPSVKYEGYLAQVIWIENYPKYPPDSMARVYMRYAIYGNSNNYKIKVCEEIGGHNLILLDSWTMNEREKTGVINFLVKQKEKNNLIFEFSDLSKSYSNPEQFSVSTVFKESNYYLKIDTSKKYRVKIY